MKKKITKKRKSEFWEGNDDCFICQAMKNGETDTMSGLMKAFKKAEKSGVGVTKILVNKNKSK